MVLNGIISYFPEKLGITTSIFDKFTSSSYVTI